MRAVEYSYFDVVSDCMMDYFNVATDYGNNFGGVHRTDGTFNSSDSYIESLWSSCYAAIKNFNIYIDGSYDVPEDLVEDAAIVRGYAYFGRAFTYLFLARHWGKAYDASTASTDLCVPLVTTYDQSARPARATVQEVYNQIKEDLDLAYILLMNQTGSVRSQYPTIDAVQALLARYYIDVKDYSSAAIYAVNVINSGKYRLSSSETAMQNEWVYDSGNEPIMQYYASTTEGTGGHSAYYYVYNNSGVYYTQEYFIPSSKLVDAYDSSDIRLSTWFGTTHPYYNIDICSYHLKYYNESASNPDYLVFSKYKGNPDLISGSYPTSVQAIKPLLISEMYLIAAEAYYYNGDSSSAKKYLNSLQSARGASSTSATEANIQNEWYKETVGEGLRMSCLKRWGLGYDGRPMQSGAESALMSGTYYEEKEFAADDYHFQWPIPSYEMQVNENLVQNEGYVSE